MSVPCPSAVPREGWVKVPSTHSSKCGGLSGGPCLPVSTRKAEMGRGQSLPFLPQRKPTRRSYCLIPQSRGPDGLGGGRATRSDTEPPSGGPVRGDPSALVTCAENSRGARRRGSWSQLGTCWPHSLGQVSFLNYLGGEAGPAHLGDYHREELSRRVQMRLHTDAPRPHSG